MIKLVNTEGREVVVTKGVYEDLYKPLGYSIKNDNKSEDLEFVKNNFKETDTKETNIKETDIKDSKAKVDK